MLTILYYVDWRGGFVDNRRGGFVTTYYEDWREGLLTILYYVDWRGGFVDNLVLRRLEGRVC